MIMFKFIKQAFILLLSFNESKFISLNNEPYLVRPNLY